MAEAPKAMEPNRFTRTIHQDRLDVCHAPHPWQTSNQASALATRKQIDPRRSGRQTWWVADPVPRSIRMALPVLTLNKTVPTSWTTAAHQSIRRVPKERNRRQPVGGPPGVASTISRYCKKAAAVKKREPTKNVIESHLTPAAEENPGTAPTAKRMEPTANRMANHQPRAPGSHQVEDAAPGCAGSGRACLR